MRLRLEDSEDGAADPGRPEGETIDGTDGVDAIAAGGGDDLVRASPKDDTVMFGDGADVLIGVADLLDGDLLIDFTRHDQVVVTGEDFASDAIRHDVDDITIENVPGLPPFIRVGDVVPATPVEFTSSVIKIDLEGDGGGGLTLKLNGDFSQREFVATSIPGGVRITLANAAPTTRDDAFTVAHDAALVGDIINGPPAGRDVDPDGDAMTVTRVDGVVLDPGAAIGLAGGGRLRVFADGTFEFDPAHHFDTLARGETRAVTFDYEITDGLDPATASVEILVLGSARGATVTGKAIRDVLRGTSKDDDLSGAGGRDVLVGRDGDDVLSGGAGNDQLRGGSGEDALRGGRGADRLAGGDGDDRLFGGQGSDVLDGGAGRDLLRGGGGGDRFVFGRADGRRDRIVDFHDGRDVIEIESGARRFGQLDVRQKGDDVVVAFSKTRFRLLDEDADDIDGSDFLFT